MPLPSRKPLEEGTQVMTLDGSWLSENDELVLYWKRKGFVGSTKLSYQPSSKAFDFLVDAFSHLELGDFFPEGGEEMPSDELNKAIHELFQAHEEPIERELTLRSQKGSDGVTRLVPRIP